MSRALTFGHAVALVVAPPCSAAWLASLGVHWAGAAVAGIVVLFAMAETQEAKP